MRIRPSFVGALVAVGLALAGGVAGAASLASPPEQETDSLPVNLSEWSIDARHIVVQANQPVRFALNNSGRLPHQLNVAGQGQEWSSPRVSAGQSDTWEVTFTTPGVYLVWCPVGNGSHKNQGMVATLTVVAEDVEPFLNVPVEMSEFAFQPMAITTVAGQTTRFQLRNVGNREHDMVIVGHGVEVGSGPVQPGETVAWDVTLDAPGTYEFMCSVGDGRHKDMGMLGILEVLPGGAPRGG